MPTSRSANLIFPSSHAFHSWWLASRPKTLVASLVPVLVASALAGRVGLFAPWTALLCLLCSLCLQLATNFINDASDFERGADTEARLGPVRMAQSGAISARGLYWGAGIVLVVAFVIGLYLVVLGGPWFLALGVGAIVAAIAYTAGPFPLAYLGLGDLFVFIFFGLVAICGGFYLQTKTIDATAFTVAATIGLLATSIIAVNNTRDIPTDILANKRTLSARLGRSRANLYVVALWLSPYFLVLALCAMKSLPWPALAVFLAAPVASRLARQIFRAETGPDFNVLLEGSAKHQFFFALLLSLGVVCG